MASHRERSVATTRTTEQHLEEQFFYGYLNEKDHALISAALKNAKCKVTYRRLNGKDATTIQWSIELTDEIKH